MTSEILIDYLTFHFPCPSRAADKSHRATFPRALPWANMPCPYRAFSCSRLSAFQRQSQRAALPPLCDSEPLCETRMFGRITGMTHPTSKIYTPDKEKSSSVGCSTPVVGCSTSLRQGKIILQNLIFTSFLFGGIRAKTPRNTGK